MNNTFKESIFIIGVVVIFIGSIGLAPVLVEVFDVSGSDAYFIGVGVLAAVLISGSLVWSFFVPVRKNKSSRKSKGRKSR